MDDQQLFAQYLDILSGLDTSLLDKHRPDAGEAGKLSGLFLSTIPKDIQQADQRIMVVGTETAGWNVLKPGERFTDLPTYIEKSMQKHQRFLESQLKQEDARGRTFFNFMRSVAARCGHEGLIYANLFCFDWKNGSPIRSPYFETIKSFSERLLKLQIRMMDPHVIIFANGMNSAPYRRDFFPVKGAHQVCRNSKDYSNDGISKHHLWEFEMFGKIRCFRVHHPSAFSKKAQEAHDFLFKLLPAAKKNTLELAAAPA